MKQQQQKYDWPIFFYPKKTRLENHIHGRLNMQMVQRFN